MKRVIAICRKCERFSHLNWVECMSDGRDSACYHDPIEMGHTTSDSYRKRDVPEKCNYKFEHELLGSNKKMYN